MSVPGIQEIQALALKYSKPQLANMAQSGLIDTQKAVLAAMMRDRISKEDAKPPTTTVTQDALGLQPPQMAQAAAQGIPPQPPRQPQMGMPRPPSPQMGMPGTAAPEMPTQMAATGGLTSIPVHMQDYAGGGIVAFAKGGDTPYTIHQYQPQMYDEAAVSNFDLEKQRQLEMQKAFGINPEFYKERSAEVGKEREELGKEKKNAWMDALIVGGLNAAAGKSPNALTNIAEGAGKGFETYQGNLKDIRARDKLLIESDNKIKEAEYLRSIGMGEAADRAIQESKKLNREDKKLNIATKNDVLKDVAKSKTEAEKTAFTEKGATSRVGMQIDSAERIANMDPAELKTIKAFHETEVANALKNNQPAPTLMESFGEMQKQKAKAYGAASVAGQKTYQEYVDQFMSMKPVVRMQTVAKLKDENGKPIDTPDKFANYMMKQQAIYAAQQQGGGKTDVSTTPPPMPDNAPKGSKYGIKTENGWQVLGEDGTLLGYARNK